MSVNATEQPLRHITSSAAMTLTHASYCSHSSSAAVFGAAKTCRNISRVAVGRSGAQRKDCTVTGGGPEVGQANLVTPYTSVNPLHQRQPISTQKVSIERQYVSVVADLPTTCQPNTHRNNFVSCVLGPVPVTMSVSTHVVVMISAMLKAPLCCAIYNKITWNI